MRKKLCTKCLKNLPLTNVYFYRDRTRTDGFAYRCKQCLGSAYGEPSANRIAGMCAAHQRPEVRARHSAAARASWQNPEVRARMLAAKDAVLQKPEVQAKRLAGLRAAMQRPGVRAKITAAVRTTTNRAEFRGRQSRIKHEHYLNPTIRERYAEANVRTGRLRALGRKILLDKGDTKKARDLSFCYQQGKHFVEKVERTDAHLAPNFNKLVKGEA